MFHVFLPVGHFLTWLLGTYTHILFLVCNTKLCLGGSAKKTFVVGHSHSTALWTRTHYWPLFLVVVGRWFRRTWRNTRCRTCGTACQRGSRSTRRSSTTGRRPRVSSSKVRHKKPWPGTTLDKEKRYSGRGGRALGFSNKNLSNFSNQRARLYTFLLSHCTRRIRVSSRVITRSPDP